MVLVSSILGAFVLRLITQNQKPKELLFCSNLPALDDFNFPIQDFDDPKLPKTPKDAIPGATMDVTNININIPGPISTIGGGGGGGPPGAAILTFFKPCTFWFGNNYPYNDPVYARDPEIGNQTIFRLDSTFLPQPKGGWLNPLNFGKGNLTRFFTQYQLQPWNYLVLGPNVNPSVVGTSPKQDPIPYPRALPNLTVPAAGFTFGNQSSGLLSSIETRYYLDPEAGGLQPVPWYQSPSSSDSSSSSPASDSKTEDAMNTAIGNALNAALRGLSTIDKTSVLAQNPTPAQLTKFFADAARVLKGLPFGGVFVDQVDHAAKDYRFTFSVGKDTRIDRAAGFPAPGLRQVLQLTQLTSGILRTSNSTLGAYTITQGVRGMPNLYSTALEIPVASFIG
ncbi:hypothetical protein HK102_010253, partial [Quaeritorhiza haematococci]